MKKNKVLYFLILCVSLSSCGDWLTINPQDQIKEGELYSYAEGYYTQINGVYKVMSEGALYGREMSFGLVDVMAHVYDVEGNYTTTDSYEYRNAATYKFLLQPRLKAMTVAIWEKSYNAISNCNSIIKHAEVADSMIFKNREKERLCILGEAHALRAMLHFDMMRLYAPSLVVKPTGAFIPYVKEFPVHVPNKTETREFINNVISDLEIAHAMTRQMDSLHSNIKSINRRLEFQGDATSGRFLSFRGYRLNYYAIKGLLARVHMYAGEPEKALPYAEQIIDLHKNKRWFEYNDEYDIKTDRNQKMYDDIIFSLYNNFQHKRFEEVNPRMDESSQSDYLTFNSFTDVFNNGEEKTDYRAKYQFTTVLENKVSIKYANLSDDRKAQYSNKMIPMIRMSEMFYIAAEALYDTNKDVAISYLQYVRGKRGVSAALPEPGTKENFLKQILNDMRRELAGEGQLLFFYKRLNQPVIGKDNKEIFPGPGFMLPIPDSNTNL